MANVDRLIERWQAHGIECPPGVTISDIKAFERAHGVVLPSDMRTYFLAVNGMGEYGTCDNDWFSFWKLQDLKTVAEDLPDRSSGFPDAATCFMFADHSIALPTFAIKLSADPNVETPIASVFADFGRFEVQYFFDSFGDFIDQYLDDPIGVSSALPDNA
ncbi:MAG TPA: SMI1/KNR4 family protein [Pirellulales bacterium]|nr:SMI1/KNR4 family protein [Pirellulales bacterium]